MENGPKGPTSQGLQIHIDRPRPWTATEAYDLLVACLADHVQTVKLYGDPALVDVPIYTMDMVPYKRWAGMRATWMAMAEVVFSNPAQPGDQDNDGKPLTMWNSLDLMADMMDIPADSIRKTLGQCYAVIRNRVALTIEMEKQWQVDQAKKYQLELDQEVLANLAPVKANASPRPPCQKKNGPAGGLEIENLPLFSWSCSLP